MGRYPWAEIALFEILHIVVFFPTRYHAYRLAVLAATVYVAAKINLTSEVSDPLMITYCVGCRIAYNFAFTLYVLYGEGSFPDHWRRTRDDADGGTVGNLEHLPSNFPFKKKLQWMFDISYSPRMIGWAQEPRSSLPPHPSSSRRDFLWTTFYKLILNYLFLDLSTLLYAHDPAFDSRVHNPIDGPETYLAALPLLRRVPYILGTVVRFATGLGAIHNIAAFVFVALGITSPTLWPDAWGCWEDAHTVRKLWGRTWHQLMRPALSGMGKLVSNKLLKFPRGTNRSSYAQLYVAFFVSGIIHLAGDFIAEKRVVYRAIYFFLLQAVVITVEDFVIYLAKGLLRQVQEETQLKLGKEGRFWLEAAVKIIGYCWVTLWFCLTLPMWQDGVSAIGVNVTDRRPAAQLVMDVWKQWPEVYRPYMYIRS